MAHPFRPAAHLRREQQRLRREGIESWEAVAGLDAALARHNETLPRLKEFILPAGTRSAALAHVSRTIARRAERAVVHLGLSESINEAPRQYLNRLSDLMFVLARVLNRMNGGDDVYWKSARMQKDPAA